MILDIGADMAGLPARPAIARPTDRRRGVPARSPVFFASRLIAETQRSKVVEYCVVDVLGAVKLMVMVVWRAELGEWTPTGSALAAVQLIGQLFKHERVVVARHLDDEVLQPLRKAGRALDLVELSDILDRQGAVPGASGLDGQIERLRAKPTRLDNAQGDALLLRACWRLVDAHLRAGAPAAATGFRPMPRELPVQTLTPSRFGLRALAWWLGAALLIQICVSGAIWLLPTN